MSTLSTQFIASEVLRLGDSLRHPSLPGCGINTMSAADAQHVRNTFLEYSMELARRAGGGRPPSSAVLRAEASGRG